MSLSTFVSILRMEKKANILNTKKPQNKHKQKEQKELRFYEVQERKGSMSDKRSEEKKL